MKAVPRDEAFFRERTTEDAHGCWIWQLHRTRSGHGRGGLHGKTTRAGGRTPVYAAVLAWEVLVGPVPQGQLVRHACGDTLCCNPAHLTLASGDTEDQSAAAQRSPRNQNSAKTRCPRCGCPFDVVEYRGDGRTMRVCRPCRNARRRGLTKTED